MLLRWLPVWTGSAGWPLPGATVSQTAAAAAPPEAGPERWPAPAGLAGG